MRALLALLLLLAPGLAWADAFSNTPPATPGTKAGTFTAGNDLRLTNVNVRPPTDFDDSAHGYAVGNVWQFNGKVWTAIKVTPGLATWQPSTSAGLPVDAIGGVAPVGAYGTVHLRAAYAGKAINVVRASDSTTLDIGFRNDGSLDTPALDAFLFGTTGRIAVWYDQSGNTNDATGAAGSQPTISPQNMIGDARSVVFDTIQSGSVGLASTVLTLPAGVAATTQGATMLAMIRSAAGNGTSAPGQWNGTGVTTSIQAGFVGSGSVWAHKITPGGTLVQTSLRPTSSPEVVGWMVSPTASTIIKGDSITTGPQTFVNNPLAGGTLGGSAVLGAAGDIDMGAVLIYARGLSATETAAVQSSLHAAFATSPQARDVLVNAGDSITFGTGASLLQTYPRRINPLINLPVQQFTIGRFGDSLANMATNYSTIYTLMYNANARNNIITIFAGTNDIASNGATGAATYAALLSWCAQARAVGWKIVVGTMLPRTGLTAGQQTEWTAYNTLMRNGWPSFADAMADFQSDDVMGPFAATSNSALYFDGIHPTDLGYTYLAPIMAAAVQSIMK